MLQKIKEYYKNHSISKYISDISWLLGEKILRMVVGLFVGVWVARYLGPDKYGLLSYSQSFVGLFAFIATLGFNSVLIRELVKNEDKRDVLLGTGFTLKFIGALFLSSVLLIIIYFSSETSDVKNLILVIGLTYIFKSFNVIDFYFQSKTLNKFVVLVNFISLLISSIIKVYLIITEKPLLYFGYVLLFDSFIISMGLIYFFIKNKLSLLNWKFDLTIAKNIIKDSWPLLFTTIMISLYSQLDQVMVKSITNPTETGYYSAAMKISSLWYFIPSVVLVTITPIIYKAKESSEGLFLKRMQQTYDLFVVYGFAVLLFVLFFGNIIIKLLYGEEYMDASIILKLLTAGSIFSILGAASSRWYMNTNNEKLILYRNIFGVVINILGNMVLIPIYGAIGSAITTFFSQLSANLIFDLINIKTRVVYKQKINALFAKNLIKGNYKLPF